MSDTAISPTAPATPSTERGEQLSARLLSAVTAGAELFTIELGRRLGLYRALQEAGDVTAAQFASTAAIAERYAREWLEQQAAAGILDVSAPSDDTATRRYRLPDEHAPVLLEEEHPLFLMGAAPLLSGIATVLPDVVSAFATGRGVSYDRYGKYLRDGIAQLNRPSFARDMRSWIATMPDVAERLEQGGIVLDAGCGTGWSSIAIARAFPDAHVIGIDLDPASIEEARRNAYDAGLTDRLRFVLGNAADPKAVQPLFAQDCTLVTIFEALHDMGSPVQALETFRSVLGRGGAVLVADERVADQYTAPADEIERFQYAVSVLHCLPATLAENGADANGTVLRAPTVQSWGAAAGFAEVRNLPIDHDFWRFYRLD